jgi:hypothetical protein
MPRILSSGKELQTTSPWCWMPEANCSPEQSLKALRMVSENHSEFKNFLRIAIRLFKAQK